MVSLVHYSMLDLSLQYLVSRRKMAWHGARANGSDGDNRWGVEMSPKKIGHN
jgi:hypothetical protein